MIVINIAHLKKDSVQVTSLKLTHFRKLPHIDSYKIKPQYTQNHWILNQQINDPIFKISLTKIYDPQSSAVPHNKISYLIKLHLRRENHSSQIGKLQWVEYKFDQPPILLIILHKIKFNQKIHNRLPTSENPNQRIHYLPSLGTSLWDTNSGLKLFDIRQRN